jgi:hypothetical protein|tara:strand:- start:1921 stop:2163 length:243 start_codon:yes stop_codon:yes gene_type:complete
MKTLFKATNLSGQVVRDRMTKSELDAFLNYNKAHDLRYTYEAYSVETMIDRFKTIGQWLSIVVLLLAFGCAILEGLAYGI